MFLCTVSYMYFVGVGFIMIVISGVLPPLHRTGTPREGHPHSQRCYPKWAHWDPKADMAWSTVSVWGVFHHTGRLSGFVRQDWLHLWWWGMGKWVLLFTYPPGKEFFRRILFWAAPVIFYFFNCKVIKIVVEIISFYKIWDIWLCETWFLGIVIQFVSFVFLFLLVNYCIIYTVQCSVLVHGE